MQGTKTKKRTTPKRGLKSKLKVKAPASIAMVATKAEEHVPTPAIIITGTGCWPLKPRPDGTCPACSGFPGHTTFACLVCDRVDPVTEARIGAATTKADERDRAERAERLAHASLVRTTKATLTEVEKRRLWNGHVGSVFSPESEPTNRALVGRKWLREIGQEPDWTADVKVKKRLVA